MNFQKGVLQAVAVATHSVGFLVVHHVASLGQILKEFVVVFGYAVDFDEQLSNSIQLEPILVGFPLTSLTINFENVNRSALMPE